MNLSNNKHCDRCFCYICDCPAAECKEWGSGNARIHHCNATSKSPTYRSQRQEHLKKNRADRARPSSAGTGGVASVRPSSAPTNVIRSIEKASVDFVRDAQKRAAQDGPGEAAALGERLFMPAPTVSAGYPDSPPPSSSDDDGGDCNCPSCRRSRNYMMDRDDYFHDDNDTGLENYYQSMYPDTQRRPVASKPKPCNLKQMPDPLLDPTMIELAQLSFEVETLRDNKISDIARRLVPHGFYIPTADNFVGEIGEKITLRSMIEQQYRNNTIVEPVIKLIPSQLTPQPSEPSPTRVVPIVVHFWDGRALPTVHGVTITPGIKLDQMMDTLRSMLDIEATINMHAQVVKGSVNASRDWSPDWSITDEWLSQHLFARDGLQLWVFCLPEPTESTRKTRPKEQQQPFKGAIINLLPAETYERHPTTSNDTRKMKLVVPLSANNNLGGIAAKEEIARNVIAALRPYRQNPDDLDETRRLVSSIQISWGMRNAYTSTPFEDIMEPYVVASRYHTKLGTLRCIGLRASFTAAVFEASFLPEIWDIPPLVGPTAGPSVVKPTRDYLKAFERVRVANIEERKLPELALKELDDASEMKDISTIPTTTTSTTPQVGPSALVRYKAQITPLVEETAAASSSRGKKKAVNEKKGTLKIRVFVFRMPGRNRVGFFDQGSEWSGTSAPRGRNHRLQRTIIPHRLKHTLWHHLQQNSDFVSLEKHRKHWAGKDNELSARRSITALMDAMERPEAPAAVQPNGLTVTLRPYQLQSLKFMWDAEIGDGGFRRHLWVPASAVDGTPFYYSPLLGRVASEVPEQPSGGFCCEEMGLGKTVEVLALCLANPAPALPAPGTVLPSMKLRSKATLVVCAVSLVGQWIAEAKEKTAGSLKIHMYHGQGRIKQARRLATEFDLIVTTYATLSSDCGTKASRGAKGGGAAIGGKRDAFSTTSSPLHAVQWHRLVLDESHTCKNPAVGHTKACVALEAQRRWMCTGTPINTDVQDLYGQFAVLGFAPFNNKNFFDANVKNAFGNNVYGGGCPELLHALGAIMVRHTKKQELGGEQVLQLPPKTEELVPGKLTFIYFSSFLKKRKSFVPLLVLCFTLLFSFSSLPL